MVRQAQTFLSYVLDPLRHKEKLRLKFNNFSATVIDHTCVPITHRARGANKYDQYQNLLAISPYW